MVYCFNLNSEVECESFNYSISGPPIVVIVEGVVEGVVEGC